MHRWLPKHWPKKGEHADITKACKSDAPLDGPVRYKSRAFKPEVKNKPQRRVVVAPRRPRKTC